MCVHVLCLQDLRAINSMLRKTDPSEQLVGKRSLSSFMEESGSETATKRLCINTSPAIQKKLEQIIGDRQATNGSQ